MKFWPAAVCTPSNFPKSFLRQARLAARRCLPLPADYHYFAGMQQGDFDVRSIFQNCIRDPQQLQPTMDRMQAMMAEYRKKK
jgi:hypothetical protein